MAVLCAGLAACTTASTTLSEEEADPAQPGSSQSAVAATSDIGKPYQVAGQWYSPVADPDYDRTGTASWYGGDFHGRRTASGEVFNANELTAAHPTLPLMSYVRVTNLSNDRSVILRVNDRGPFRKGRLIDVSRRAAEMLDFKRAGSADVRVEYVQAAKRGVDDSEYLMASYQGPRDYPVPSREDPPAAIAVASVETPKQTPETTAFVAAEEPPEEGSGGALAAVKIVTTGQQPDDRIALAFQLLTENP